MDSKDSPPRTIFPGKEIRDKSQPTEWHFVQDLQALNAVVHASDSNVLNPYTTLSQVPTDAKWFALSCLMCFLKLPTIYNDALKKFGTPGVDKRYSTVAVC